MRMTLHSGALFLGPVLGIGLVLLAIAGNSGPGFFLLTLVALPVLGLVVPSVQLVLRRSAWFSSRPIAGLSLALAGALGTIVAVSTLPVFNQW